MMMLRRVGGKPVLFDPSHYHQLSSGVTRYSDNLPPGQNDLHACLLGAGFGPQPLLRSSCSWMALLCVRHEHRYKIISWKL